MPSHQSDEFDLTQDMVGHDSPVKTLVSPQRVAQICQRVVKDSTFRPLTTSVLAEFDYADRLRPELQKGGEKV